jgi:choline dehydrogenase
VSRIGNGRASDADVIIVGGGTADSVLASRLSEDPTRSVLLLDAGTAYGVDGYPDDLLDPARVPATPEHEWAFTARGGAASPELDAPRAKVLGGCSAHNATVAMRARPSDIRDWQECGLDHGTVVGVMATFKELENTPDGEDTYHGRTGPFPIRVRRGARRRDQQATPEGEAEPISTRIVGSTMCSVVAAPIARHRAVRGSSPGTACSVRKPL